MNRSCCETPGAEPAAGAAAPAVSPEPVKSQVPAAAAEPVVEESAAAEPVAAEPVVEEPVVEEPVVEEPAAEEPAAAEPVAAEPAVEEKPWNHFTEEPWPKSVILARANQAEKKVREWIATYGNKFDQLEFAFNFYAGSNRIHVVYDDAEIPDELWFIGDLHGDILALDSALSYIDSHSVSPTIVFLGDLFDRFDYGLEVVMRVLALIIERPGKILWIAGNHDATFDFLDDRFVGGYTPAEFIDFLNAHPEHKEFGKWLAGFVKTLPAALFLPDGLFAAHGGCLGFDVESFSGNLIDKVSTLEELESGEYLMAFIKNRFLNDIQPLDLPEFMAGMSKFTGYPVKRMLRGHDHCREKRHEFSEDAPYLTISTMSTWYLGVIDDPGDDEMPVFLRKSPITTPAVARFRYDAMPEVFTLDIPRSVVEQFHAVEDLKKTER